jgi:hypothetical protein
MTDTATELSPIVKQGSLALKDKDATLASVVSAVLAVMPEVEAVVPVPKVPQPLVLDQETKEALSQVPAVFAAVQPETARVLTETEVASLYLEREVLRKVTDVLDGRDEAIKEYIRNHFDRIVEAEGKAESAAIDAKGHYVVATKGNPERLPISGTNKAWSREYRAGKPSVNGERLLEMYEAGEISREDYLAFTRETRVFDEDKAYAAIVAKPERLEILANLAVPATESTSIFVRAAKA